MDQDALSLLVKGADFLNLSLSPKTLSILNLYLNELQRWAPVFNLVGQHDTTTVIQRHILDSLAISHLLPSRGSFVDLGSGAGFPGFILAAAEPAREYVLVEARRKRANFLKEVARSTGIKNIKVHEGRVECLAKQNEMVAVFHAVTTRATWSTPQFLAFSAPFLKKDGIALLMQGPRKGKSDRMADTHGDALGFDWDITHDYSRPFGEGDRCAVLFRRQCFT
ncbi:MAG: 16S rRNA (guanine(527)-N(7))-methyltransferase RsmG [Deltaproteobacteria bacterium]|nr:16S rRNA (guanine(527)-N(7))-methyltransferase RsmG [Deltaproteobacteria bacterium]